jgi:hypothetical protein
MQKPYGLAKQFLLESLPNILAFNALWQKATFAGK